MIHPVRLGHVIKHAENDDEPYHCDAVIHCRGGGGRFGRPEAEEEDDNHVGNATDVHSDARPSGYAPWAPGRLSAIAALTLRHGLVGWGDAAGATAPEKEDRAE